MNDIAQTQVVDDTLERSLAIVAAINSFLLVGVIQDHKVDFASLKNLSLFDMLAAVEAVNARNDAESKKEGAHTIHLVPDDRLTAAVYAFLHFMPDYTGPDGDEIVLRVPLGDDGETFLVGFLARGNRSLSRAQYYGEDDEEDGEAED